MCINRQALGWCTGIQRWCGHALKRGHGVVWRKGRRPGKCLRWRISRRRQGHGAWRWHKIIWHGHCHHTRWDMHAGIGCGIGRGLVGIRGCSWVARVGWAHPFLRGGCLRLGGSRPIDGFPVAIGCAACFSGCCDVLIATEHFAFTWCGIFGGRQVRPKPFRRIFDPVASRKSDQTDAAKE